MLMNNGNNVAMFNKGSRFSIVFDDFGFGESTSQNVAPIQGSHGNLISFEYVADAKPEVIFILDREQAIGRSVGKAKELFNNPLVNSTPAAQNKKIVYINPNAWYISGGGVTATQTMIADIDKALN
jgi:iron complex transport system substrate-binding protein